MAVTDFGGRRHMDSAPRKARQYPYQHQAHDAYQEEYGWYDDDQNYPDEYPESLGARLGRVTHYIGAIVSVALLVGLIVWGYKLVARDVSGVPVIRAAQGEARVSPDDPGGELTQNSGLSVNEVAAGVEIPPSAEIAIAPAPTGLENDDVAMGELADSAALDAMRDEIVPVSPDDPVIAVSDAETALGLNADGSADLGALDIVATESEADPDLAETVSVAAVRPPAPRPASIATRAQIASAAPAKSSAAIEAAVTEAITEAKPSPVRVAAGSPLVQIGAFDSNSIANSEWGRISGRYSSLFSGKSPVVQSTKRNGRTFYRLRVAGFESRDDARRFCAALIAEGTDCYPASAK